MDLSSSVVFAQFNGGMSRPVTPLIDYEFGGIAIEDVSQGFLYQMWRARYFDGNVLLSADEVEEFSILEADGISEISFTFDQQMRVQLAYVQNGETKLYHYDISSYVTTNFGSTYISPRISLDRRTELGILNSDIVFAYVRSGSLCIRLQSDRYLTEYVLADCDSRLIKVGMNRQNRFQFFIENP